MKKSLICAGVVLVLALGIYLRPTDSNIVLRNSNTQPQVIESNLKIGNTSINVTFARTEEERTAGLSGKEALQSNEGLLFVFEGPMKPGFWMKDMKFPIDIIWINENKEVVSCEKNVKPESYPKVYYPRKATQYVLEVVAGFCDTEGVREGERLVWTD